MFRQKQATHGDLVKIDKHPNYFQNPISGKIYFRKRINGRAVKIATGTTKISEAKKIVDEKLIELFSIDPAKEKRTAKGIKNPLIRELWVEMVAERSPQRHDHTVRHYRVAWEHGLEEFWGKKTTGDLTEQNIRKFENWYLLHKGDRTFFNTHKYFTMFLRYCERHQYIPSPRPTITDLDLVISARKKKKKVGRVYTDAEISAILSNSNELCKMGVYFGRFLGMRKMEVLTLKWSHISFKEKKADVWSMKNKKWREVAIPEWLINELQKWKSECEGSEYVFPAPQNKETHVASQVFDKSWKRAQKKANISGWDVENEARFHDLRHTFATQTANEGWPIMYACQMLDMSVKEYQRTYAHVGAFDIQKQINKSMKKPR